MSSASGFSLASFLPAPSNVDAWDRDEEINKQKAEDEIKSKEIVAISKSNVPPYGKRGKGNNV